MLRYSGALLCRGHWGLEGSHIMSGFSSCGGGGVKKQRNMGSLDHHGFPVVGWFCCFQPRCSEVPLYYYTQLTLMHGAVAPRLLQVTALCSV